MPSYLIKNGIIVDGTNRPAFPGHLLTDSGRIAAVISKDEGLPDADTIIDVEGDVIAPGFIDMHSHSDWVMPRWDHPEAMKCLVEQGITTIIAGNCGFSPAPLTVQSREALRGNASNLLTDRPIDYDWSGMDEFMDKLAAAGPLVNIAQQVGHGVVRTGYAGISSRPLTGEQSDGCLGAIRRALDAGACAVSFGLGYAPGMFAPLDELEAIFRLSASLNKPVTVHLKALSRLSPTYPVTELRPHNIRALKEILDLAEKTGVTLQISHLIFVGRRSWSTAERALELIEAARKRGVDVMFDAFPYTCGNTTIDAALPYWYIDLRQKGRVPSWAHRLAGAELRLGFSLLGFSFGDFQVMDAGPESTEYEGMRVSDLARRWGISEFDAFIRLSEKTPGGAVVLIHRYSGEPGDEQVLESVLGHDLCLFETDAMTRYRGFPNPAAIGCFPKILQRFVREKQLFGIENAIHRMTAASAARFRLADRGILAPGKSADITVFNPATISERPGAGVMPAGKPEGVRHVFINGAHVVENGRYIDRRRAGQILRI